MRYIDQDKIYDSTEQGLTIFEFYFPGEDLKDSKKFFRIRSEDKTASAKLNWYDRYWRITDFGNQDQVNGMKAIDFVKWKETLPYYDALLFIEQVIIGKTIEAGAFQKCRWTPDYEMREMLPEDKKGEYKFTFKESASPEDLSAIGRYVTQDILNDYNCKSVDNYSYCGHSKKLNKDVVHIFKSNKDYPIFLFDYGDFKKLYRPHEQEKKNRFLYIGEKPKDFIYGLKQIEDSDSEFTDAEDDDGGEIKKPEDKPDAQVKDIFRCSGESDALNLASLGFHVYWLNSETTDFAPGQYKMIDQLCENHYQIMDLDATGRSQAVKNALKHISLYSIELPEWLKIKKDFRGNPCKDLKDFLNLSGSNEEDTKHNFLVLKRNARRVKFWNKTIDKNKQYSYSINMEFYFFFLKVNGFYQMDSIYHKKAGYCYARVRGKVVDLIHPDDMKRTIKRFTKEWLKGKNLMDCIEILNKINTSNQISEANLESIDEIKINFKNYDKSTEYLHFKNGSFKIMNDKIEKIKHEDIPNFILGKLEINNKSISHLIDKDIRLIQKPAIEVTATAGYQELIDKLAMAKTDDERETINVTIAQFPDPDKYEIKINDDDFIFIRFLKDLSRLYWRKDLEQKKNLTDEEKKEENLSLANLLFILGYHCSQYKDPGKPWLTFLQDMKISEVGQSSGRSGKSLLTKAITYARTSFYKGGRTLDNKNEYQFFYDGMTEFHDFIEVDDLHEFADFSFFYTQVTGKREINPKNYAPFTLEYENSGKMLISSNYELQNVNSSTLARLLNGGVSDYYHEATKYNDYKETRTPLTKFGRRLYDDFTEDEWVRFYNLIAYCIQLSMRFYKIQPPLGNLEKRQYRRAMSQGLGKDEDFFSWANEYFVPVPNNVSKPDFSPAEYGFLNTYIIRENAFNAFREKLSKKQQADYRSGKFKTHVEAWANYYGFTLNPIELCNGNDKSVRRIIKTIDGSSRECFFISSKNNTEEPINTDNNTNTPPF